MSTIGKATL